MVAASGSVRSRSATASCSARTSRTTPSDGLPTEQHAAYYAARAAGGSRPDHHRGALDPPDRLALREADPRLPPRGDPRLPAHHRRRPPPPHADLRPDQPQRRPGVVDVHPPAGVGAVAGGRPAVPRGAQGGRRRPRSPRSSPATPPSPSTAPRAASTASSCSARTRRSSAASCRRPPTGAPTSYGGSLDNRARLLLEIVAAVRDAIGARPGPRRAALRRRADRGRHHHRRGGRGGPSWSRPAATSTTSTPRSAWPPPACS